MRGSTSILSLFRNKFNNSIIQKHECYRFYLSQDIKITSESHFGLDNVKILASFTQYYNGIQNFT